MVSDGMLSQDEIDALLRGSGPEEMEEESDVFLVEDYISLMEQDALGEIGNISFGSSATALSTLLNQKVDITTPTVSVIPKVKINEEFPHPYVAIQVSYTEGFSGSNLLVIQQGDAAIIADLMLGGDGLNPGDLMGEIQLSAVQEAMNQMMGSAATSMSTIFSKRVDISPPTIDLLDVQSGEGTHRLPNEEMMVKISFRLKVGDLIDSNIMQLLPLDFAKSLVTELMNPTPAQVTQKPSSVEDIPVETGQNITNSLNSEFTAPPMQGQQPEIWQQQPQYAGFQEQGYQNYPQNMGYQTAPQHFGSSMTSTIPQNVQPAVFSNFEPMRMPETETKNLNMLLDIPLQVSVELGRTKRSVKEILELSSGSIIELDKLAGEPVDILVNNRLIAKGEVVVIDENFGVRVTDIISQSDRIKKLR
ncbi:flagellar motor switch phosphatase FliY [Bacillus sp. CGMCC 1.16607]|uniref:flagellar motor switch phosphatase FliY n=1 Tax=Bacillus sp. CGMCC 1.16607 TaxID=3351842 RepID=UPI00362F89FF